MEAEQLKMEIEDTKKLFSEILYMMGFGKQGVGRIGGAVTAIITAVLGLFHPMLLGGPSGTYAGASSVILGGVVVIVHTLMLRFKRIKIAVVDGQNTAVNKVAGQPVSPLQPAPPDSLGYDLEK